MSVPNPQHSLPLEGGSQEQSGYLNLKVFMDYLFYAHLVVPFLILKFSWNPKIYLFLGYQLVKGPAN